MQRITPFLMFEGQAEEAMNFYVSLFDRAEIRNIIRYGPERPGDEGTVMLATLSLDGQEFTCIDSNVQHAFTFTPPISLYVTCAIPEHVARPFASLMA